MKHAFTVPQRTVDAQRLAASPTTSAWVSANAGSGKTFVLTRRVIRLLLAGTPAARILCLTFTKAAAATRANRVYEVLNRKRKLSLRMIRNLHEGLGIPLENLIR